MPTLYLIDGYAQMFRSYFAIRGGMSSPVTGEPTNACFAFTGMLLKLFREVKPEYVAMAVDPHGPTFRDEIYEEYKANRDEAPDDFKPQIPVMIEIAKMFGIPVINVPGAEADDVMATLATTLPAEDDAMRLALVSKDKDLYQVMSDRVVLFDIHTDTTLDVAGLHEKVGITPGQAIDYQTLIGDSTDNIPGVKGIGPKTAVKLLGQFETVAKLVENTDQLKGKQKENVEAAIADGTLELTRQLVTLKTDLDLSEDFSLEESRVELSQIDAAGLTAKFKQLGFNRYPRELSDLLGKDVAGQAETQSTKEPSKNKKKQADAQPFGLFASAGSDSESETESQTPVRAATGRDYPCIKTQQELDEVIASIKSAKLLCVDTETTGLNLRGAGRDTELVGICLAWQKDHGVYIPVRSPESDQHLSSDVVIAALKPILEDAGIAKCGHHLKYDYLVLKRAGIELKGIAFDSLIGGFLDGQPGLKMDDLALNLLNYEAMPITDLIGAKPRKKADPPQKTMDEVALALITPYAAEDADITLQLCNLLRGHVDAKAMTELADTIEMPLIEVLSEMEWAGITVDPKILKQQQTELAARIDELKSEILDAAQVDFNVDSPKQLGDVLFNQLGFPVIKKTKTGFSTDSEVLEKLAERAVLDELGEVRDTARVIPAFMIEYRMLTKLVGTYLESLVDCIHPETKRIHTSFHQTGAATGRLSSNNPNLQNIPIRTEVGRNIRKAFVAANGHELISVDYSQIELRVLAHLSEDANLIQAFQDDQDIHTSVAAQVFNVEPDDVTSEQRGQAKTINFGIIYGITAYGLARRIGEIDNKQAEQLITDYRAKFPGIDRFLEQCIQQAEEHGYVTTIFGRRRDIPEINSGQRQTRSLGERLAINTVVQGSAADLIKKAMVDLHQKIESEQLPMTMLLQIHDELVIEAPKKEASAMQKIVEEVMEGAMAMKVPLKAEGGRGADWFACK